jgi:FOG: WD40 repeat
MIAFSRDALGQRVASGSVKAIRVWSVSANRIGIMMYRHLVDCVSWSRNGPWIATRSSDNLVHLLDAETTSQVCEFNYYLPSWSLAFTPDSCKLLGGRGYRDCIWGGSWLLTQRSRESGSRASVACRRRRVPPDMHRVFGVLFSYRVFTWTADSCWVT